MKTSLMKSFLLFPALFLLGFLPAQAGNIYQNSITAAPQAITLTVTNIRYNSFTLSWTAHPDATKYRLWVKKEISGNWEVFTAYNGKEYGMTTLTVDITDVSSTWNYTRQVILQAIKNTTVVEEATKIFDLKPKPHPFTVSYIPGSTTISVEWFAHYDGYMYFLYAYKNDGGTLTPLSGYPKAFDFSEIHDPYTHKVTGLDFGTKYEFSVKQKSDDIWGDTIHKIQYTSPAIPQALVATVIKPNSFVANWNTTQLAPQYKLYVKESDTDKWILRGLPVEGKMNYKMENLESGTNYEYQVSSLNPLGESGLSGVVKVFTTNLPVPVAISPSSVAGTYFEARWNTLTNATGYLLQVSDGNVWTNYPISSGSTSSFLLTGMKPDFTYEYRVRAYFGEDYTKYSNVITLKTQNSPVAKGASLQDDPTKVTLIWDPATGATGYRLYVISNENAADNPEGYFPKILGNVQNHFMTGLKTGHSYQFYLDGIIPSGNTTISNKLNFFTKPATPVALNPTEITATSFKAHWEVFDDVDETYLSVFVASNGIPVTGFNNKLVNGTSETVTGLTYNTQYYYLVKVKKNGLSSFPSATKNVKTDYVELKLTASPVAGGTLTGGGWIKRNTSVTVNATPAAGYEFVNWTKGTTPVSTSQSYSFNITENTTLTANFNAVVPVYTLNLMADPVAGGTVTGGGSFNSGTWVTVEGIPNQGYEFVNWTEGKTIISNNAVYSFSLGKSRNLTANFKQSAVNYTISVSANPTNGGSAVGSGSYVSGSSVTVNASAYKGFEFINWTERGREVSQLASYKFNAVSNRSLIANFQTTGSTSFVLSLKAVPVEGGTVSGGGKYTSGTSVSALATPYSGYSFVNWTENDSEVSTDANFTFNLNANRSLTANFVVMSGVNAPSSYPVFLYPNPASNILKIDGIREKTSVKFYNISGVEVLNEVIDSSTYINITSLIKGLYFVVLESDLTKHTFRIVKN